MTGSKNTGRAFLLALAFFFLSSPVWSQSADQEFLSAAQEIANLHPDCKPLIAKMANALRKISEESKANTAELSRTIDEQAKKISDQANSIRESQTTIESQAIKLTENEQTISDLKASRTDSTRSQGDFETQLQTDAANMKTSATIGWTVAGVSLLGNLIEGLVIAFRK